MLNHYIAIGRFVQDPVLQKTKADQPFVPFRLAIDRDYKTNGKYEADYISCCLWGSGAAVIVDHFKKGSRICIEGRIQTRSYEKDGKKYSTNEVVVSAFYFVDQKTDSSTSLSKEERLEPDTIIAPDSQDTYEEDLESK